MMTHETHTHTQKAKRERRRESVLIITENKEHKEQKNERRFYCQNTYIHFALSQKKLKYILMSATKSSLSREKRKSQKYEGEFQPESCNQFIIIAFCGI